MSRCQIGRANSLRTASPNSRNSYKRTTGGKTLSSASSNAPAEEPEEDTSMPQSPPLTPKPLLQGNDLLISMQNNLNLFIDKDWKKNRTVDDFQTETILEIAELMECFPHKWWKKQKFELENAKMELVDVLHFALSGLLLQEEKIKHVKLDVASVVTIPFCKYLIQLALKNRFNEIILHLFNLSKKMEFDIVAYYVAKFTLNKIRQLRGYKTGEYTKVIHGIEDNEMLSKCIEDSIEYQDISKKVYDFYDIPSYERLNLSDINK